MMGSESRVFHEQLPNGLKLLGECNPQNKSCAIGFFVRTGARDETEVEAGVSHFLEHMMFKGTPTRNAIQISFELGNMGAQANAFTSEENTVYYAVVLPEYFKSAQALLSDMLRPSLDQAEFDTEKKVILEEIALYKDKPHFYLFEHALQEYFQGHAAGNSVLGSTESIAAVTRDQMKDYFDRRYCPSNITLVASGNFDWNSFRSDAEKLCGSWKRVGASRDIKPFTGKAIRKDFKKANLNQSHVALMSSSPSAQDQERTTFAVISTILGDSVGSKFYWELVNPGICEAASTEADEKDGTGIFTAFATCDADKLDQVVEKMRAILSKPLDFTDKDLDRAKTKLASRLVLGGELPMGRLMSLGSEWVYRKRIHSLSETLKDVRSVTRNTIEAALKRFPLNTWAEFRLISAS